MSTLVLFELTAKPDAAGALRAFLDDVLPATRAYDGCESVTMHVEQDAPTAILLVQRWASRDHHARYQAWRDSRTEEAGGVRELVTGPPSVRFFDDAGA